MTKELEEALIAALTIASREGGRPDKLWHPHFGWVDLTNDNDPHTQAFYKYLQEHNK